MLRQVSVYGILLLTALPCLAEKELFYAGAKFPSADFAPIKYPYIFLLQAVPAVYSYGGLPVDDFTHVPPFNVNAENNRGSRAYFDVRSQLFRDIGTLPIWSLQNKGATLTEQIQQCVDNQRPGLIFDEFLHNCNTAPCPDTLAYTDTYREVVEAVRSKIGENNPMLVAGWVSNYLQKIPKFLADNDELFDFYSVEAYLSEDIPFFWNIFNSYLSNIKRDGYGKKTLVAMHGGYYLSWVDKDSWPTEDEIRRQVQAIRDSLPESPGFGLWAPAEYINQTLFDDKFLRAANDFYYDKSPSAAITSPAESDTVGGTVDITVQGTPNATTQEALSSYRFFVDNECVYVGEQATYQWDANSWTEGTHTVTAHALDAKWLAGAAQIQVTVDHDVTATAMYHPRNSPDGVGRSSDAELYDLCGRRIRGAPMSRGMAGMRGALPQGVYLACPKGSSSRTQIEVACER
jgi:hypothetical protein